MNCLKRIFVGGRIELSRPLDGFRIGRSFAND